MIEVNKRQGGGQKKRHGESASSSRDNLSGASLKRLKTAGNTTDHGNTAGICVKKTVQCGGAELGSGQGGAGAAGPAGHGGELWMQSGVVSKILDKILLLNIQNFDKVSKEAIAKFVSNLLKESYDGFKQSPASDAFIEKCFETVKSFYRQEWVNGSCVAKEQAKQFQKFAEGCANRSLVTISKLLKQVNQIGPLLSHPPGDLDHVVGTSPPEGGGGGGGCGTPAFDHCIFANPDNEIMCDVFRASERDTKILINCVSLVAKQVESDARKISKLRNYQEVQQQQLDNLIAFKAQAVLPKPSIEDPEVVACKKQFADLKHLYDELEQSTGRLGEDKQKLQEAHQQLLSQHEELKSAHSELRQEVMAAAQASVAATATSASCSPPLVLEATVAIVTTIREQLDLLLATAGGQVGGSSSS